MKGGQKGKVNKRKGEQKGKVNKRKGEQKGKVGNLERSRNFRCFSDNKNLPDHKYKIASKESRKSERFTSVQRRMFHNF